MIVSGNVVIIESEEDFISCFAKPSLDGFNFAEVMNFIKTTEDDPEK